MSSLCHDRNSCGDERCNSRSVLVNILFFFVKYHIWKPSLRPQKSSRFNNNFALASRVVYISLPSLHDYDMKVPFCGGRKLNTATFFFFCWTSIQSVDELNERKSSRIHFFSGVFVAVAIVVAWAPSGSFPRAWSEISSPCLRNLISQLSFLLVPNMALAKIKIHQHRTKQTCKIYTFQPFMSYASQTLWALAQFSTRCAFCFNTFSHLIHCVSCPCNSSFCF